ncbi:MAG: hypothetical protein IJQ97_06865 [Paludibacteraceae bacterium]|nr:hypothetical protein [Paludibacteraceae bacterium]
MKRLLPVLAMIMWIQAAFAEGSLSRPFVTIAEITNENDQSQVSVCDMPEDDAHTYYLCVGSMAFGDEIIQVHIDPVTQLFLPLGSTLQEALSTMESFADLANDKPGTTRETIGVLAVGNPTMGEPETVYLTAKQPFISKILECSVQREGYIRAVYVQRSDLKSLIFNIKVYQKMNPNL